MAQDVNTVLQNTMNITMMKKNVYIAVPLYMVLGVNSVQINIISMVMGLINVFIADQHLMGLDAILAQIIYMKNSLY